MQAHLIKINDKKIVLYLLETFIKMEDINSRLFKIFQIFIIGINKANTFRKLQTNLFRRSRLSGAKLQLRVSEKDNQLTIYPNSINFSRLNNMFRAR